MRSILLFTIALISLTACKKTNLTPGLFGRWELRHKMGTIVGFDSTYAAGNGRILQLKSDSSYQQYSQGELIIQGTFHIQKTDYPQPNLLSIFFDDSSYENLLILKGDKLQIGMDINDGVEADYVKIAD